MARSRRRRRGRIRTKPRRGLRRRNNPSVAPPPINIDPWFKITLSFEDKASGNLDCVIVQDLYSALDKQLDLSRTGKYYVMRIHRLRVWNLSGKRLFLEPCQLIEKHDCNAVKLPMRSFEAYPGAARWAYISYNWPRNQQRMEQDDNQNKAVVFTRKADKDSQLVIHIVVSFKITTSASFVANHRPLTLVSHLTPWNNEEVTPENGSGLEEFEHLSVSSINSSLRRSLRLQDKLEHQ